MSKRVESPNQIFSLNYANENCEFTATNGNLWRLRYLCDFNPYGSWFTGGDKSVEISVSFRDDYGRPIDRLVDTVILQNCNLKDFTISLADKDGNEVFAKSFNNYAKVDGIIRLDNKRWASKLILKVNGTQDGKEAKLGQLRACRSILKLKATTETQVSPTVSEGRIRTYDGRVICWTNYEKWGAEISIENLSKESLNLLKEYIEKDGYITLVPWEDCEIRDIYECRVLRESVGSYRVNRWSGLVSQTLKAEAKEDARN